MKSVRRFVGMLSVFCTVACFLTSVSVQGMDITIHIRSDGNASVVEESTPADPPSPPRVQVYYTQTPDGATARPAATFLATPAMTPEATPFRLASYLSEPAAAPMHACSTCTPPPCGPIPCSEATCLPSQENSRDLESCKKKEKNPLWKSGGWYEFGIYGNSHGATFNEGGNGPMHTAGNQRTDFHLDQYYIYEEKELDTRRGWDIGGRMDLVYGVDAPGMQSTGDRSFDYGWGRNHHGYALAMYQLYGTIGYKKLQVKMGKFGTPIGWEGSASQDNFFYSHSYCYWLEPTTHVGVLADYQLTDRLTLHGGWVAGENNGFKNHYHDKSFLGGFTWELTDKATIYYWLTVGKTNNRFRLGDWRFDDGGFLARQNHYVQSLCFEWMPTERFTYVLQYNLRNDTDIRRQDYRSVGHYSSYGINQHFLYKLSDSFSTGLRVEWLRDNGGFGYITEDPANYFQLTLGLNWFWSERCCLRPEVRYDSVLDGTARPYGNGHKRDQVTGGIGFLVGY